MQLWEPWKHRPLRLEIYKGDTDHRRENTEYFGSGQRDIQQIQRFKVRHTVTETGERTELIPHGINMMFYDNTLAIKAGQLDLLAGVARIDCYDDGKLVGFEVFDREGHLIASQGTVSAIDVHSPGAAAAPVASSPSITRSTGNPTRHLDDSATAKASKAQRLKLVESELDRLRKLQSAQERYLTRLQSADPRHKPPQAGTMQMQARHALTSIEHQIRELENLRSQLQRQ
jgi:hypothetical protein